MCLTIPVVGKEKSGSVPAVGKAGANVGHMRGLRHGDWARAWMFRRMWRRALRLARREAVSPSKSKKPGSASEQ